MANLHEHWERAYSTNTETAVSWYQPELVKSLGLVRKAAGSTRASIVDIGGGASTLPDSLLHWGCEDITVVDISGTALQRFQHRLGLRSAQINWIIADITHWSPKRTWDVWHDRAVFHFLTDPTSQDAYIAALQSGTHVGSSLILSCFGLDGPERCSGLPIQRYNAEGLATRIGPPFKLVEQHVERHITPGGTVQSFSYAFLKRT